MLLFADKPLPDHLEDRENYLVFTQTISRFERKISFWRNVSKNTMHCRARSGRILAKTRGDYRAFWLKTLELIIIDKSCPRTPSNNRHTSTTDGVLSPFRNLPQFLAPRAMIKVNIIWCSRQQSTKYKRRQTVIIAVCRSESN